MQEKLLRLCFILLLGIVSMSEVASQEIANRKNTVILRGQITTLRKTPIKGVKVHLEKIDDNESPYLVEGITNKDGEFGLVVPKGIYAIKIDGWGGTLSSEKEVICSPKCEWYFNDFQRANIDLSQVSSLNINIAIIKEGFFVSGETTPLNEAKYDTIKFGQEDSLLNMVIRYLEKEVSDEKVIYKTPNNFQKNVFYPVNFLTYNNIIIYSDDLELNKNKNQITIKGKIIVNDGLSEFNVKKVIICFSNGNPVFTFER